jgi:hypothetical protein
MQGRNINLFCSCRCAFGLLWSSPGVIHYCCAPYMRRGVVHDVTLSLLSLRTPSRINKRSSRCRQWIVIDDFAAYLLYDISVI